MASFGYWFERIFIMHNRGGRVRYWRDREDSLFYSRAHSFRTCARMTFGPRDTADEVMWLAETWLRQQEIVRIDWRPWYMRLFFPKWLKKFKDFGG